jgi:hypothetical protein
MINKSYILQQHLNFFDHERKDPFCPLLRPNTKKKSVITNWTLNDGNASQLDIQPLPLPFGSTLSTIDPRKTLRIIFQNPQFSTQIGGKNTMIHHMISKLIELQTSIFAINSPNIN